MSVNSRINKYNPRYPKRRAVGKRVVEIEAHDMKRAKTLDATFAAGYNSNPFLSVYKSDGMNWIDFACCWSFWQSKQRIQGMNLFSSEGGCRITRSRKQSSCELCEPQKEKSLRFIHEKVQSCARLYGDKDSYWTNDTSGTIYKLQLRQHALGIPEEPIQNKGIHCSIKGKTMMRVICLVNEKLHPIFEGAPTLWWVGVVFQITAKNVCVRH